MSNFSELENNSVTRRDFLLTASALTTFCLLNCEGLAQVADSSKFVKALDDPDVIHGMVSFKSGDGEIDAFLSRPKNKGRFPIVIVITGNSIAEEYIQNMTAMLAQKGIVGIAPNIYSLQKDTMSPEEKRKVFVEQITDERIFQDIQASIDYLKKQDFVKRKKIGITGFCFGGRCALMFATHSREIDAVAPFYGNLRTPPFANRKSDPLDVLDKINVPVQGHYSKNDQEIPPDQLRTLESTLKKQGTMVEIFTYDAPHGFFAYTRKTYDPAAADLSWRRTTEFFKKTLDR